jgi:hypothetical protein
MSAFGRDLRSSAQIYFKDDRFRRFNDPEMPSTVTGKYKFAIS